MQLKFKIVAGYCSKSKNKILFSSNVFLLILTYKLNNDKMKARQAHLMMKYTMCNVCSSNYGSKLYAIHICNKLIYLK